VTHKWLSKLTVSIQCEQPAWSLDNYTQKSHKKTMVIY